MVSSLKIRALQARAEFNSQGIIQGMGRGLGISLPPPPPKNRVFSPNKAGKTNVLVLSIKENTNHII